MNITTHAFELASLPLTLLLDRIPVGHWDNATPCEGWSVRDVVGHLIETQREFFARNDIDLGVVPEIGHDPAAAWQSHMTSVLQTVADDAIADTAFDGGFGHSTIGDTLVQFYVWDMVAHRWDIARGAGQDAELTDSELDRLENGIASFGDALYMDGICKPGVTAPADADRATFILAELGRQL